MHNPYISIHAVTWTATKAARAGAVVENLFQFTQSRGLRLARPLYDTFGAIFQFTQSRGLRRLTSKHQHTRDRFQFTQSRGLRPISTSLVSFGFHISIHAVTWTATSPVFLHLLLKRSYFNSRSHVDCDTETRNYKTKTIYISIHAVTWTATLPIHKLTASFMISNHAVTWTATTNSTRFDPSVLISIHAVTWTATSPF